MFNTRACIAAVLVSAAACSSAPQSPTPGASELSVASTKAESSVQGRAITAPVTAVATRREPVNAGGVPSAKTQAFIEQNSKLESDFNAIARIITDDGNAVEVLEPMPGRISFVTIFSTGPSLRQRVPKIASMRSTDLFAALWPQLPIPDVLAEAEGRVVSIYGPGQPRELVATTTGNSGTASSSPGTAPSTSVPPPGGVEPDGCGSYCAPSCFESRECTGLEGDYTWCFSPAYDGAYANSDNYNVGEAVVCAQTGTPYFYLWSFGLQTAAYVSPGTELGYLTYWCAYYPFFCGDQEIDFEVDYNGHSSNTFGFAGYFTND